MIHLVRLGVSLGSAFGHQLDLQFWDPDSMKASFGLLRGPDRQPVSVIVSYYEDASHRSGYRIYDDGVVQRFAQSLFGNDGHFGEKIHDLYHRLACFCGCDWSRSQYRFKADRPYEFEVPSHIWSVAHAAWWAVWDLKLNDCRKDLP